MAKQKKLTFIEYIVVFNTFWSIILFIIYLLASFIMWKYITFEMQFIRIWIVLGFVFSLFGYTLVHKKKYY